MTMADWGQRVDEYLRLLRRNVLAGAGSVSRVQADAIAHERYGRFDLARRDAERLAADAAATRDLRTAELAAVRLAKAARTGKS